MHCKHCMHYIHYIHCENHKPLTLSWRPGLWGHQLGRAVCTLFARWKMLWGAVSRLNAQQFLHIGSKLSSFGSQMYERIEKTDVPHHGTSIKQPPCPKLRVTILNRSGNFFVTSWHVVLVASVSSRGRAMLFQAAGCKGQHHRAMRGWTALVAILWRCKRQELCRSRGFSARFGLARDIWRVPWFQFKASQVFLQRFDDLTKFLELKVCLGTFGASLCQTLGGPFCFFFRPNRFPIFADFRISPSPTRSYPPKKSENIGCRIKTHFSQDSSGWWVSKLWCKTQLAVRVVLVCWMWWMIYDGDDLVIMAE